MNCVNIGINRTISANKVNITGTNIPNPNICKVFFKDIDLFVLCINLGEIHKLISHKIIVETIIAPKE